MKKIDVNNVSSIREGIKSVLNRSGTLQNDIQRVALATLHHCKAHGDWTLVVELRDGITASKGMRHSKLTQYFEAMMSATFETDDDGKTRVAYDEGKSAKDINLEMAEAVKWYDFKVEKAPQALDIAAAIAKLSKQIHKAKTVEFDAQAVEHEVASLQAALDTIRDEILEAALEESQEQAQDAA